MAAIITDDFRKNLASSLIEEVSKAYDTPTPGEAYYIGIGKSDPWTDSITAENAAGFAPSVPDGSIREKEEVRDNLMGLIKIETAKASRVIPKINYLSGQSYKQYDADDPTAFIPSSTQNPCYAVHEISGQEKIFVCLRNNNGANTGVNDTPQVTGTYSLSGSGGNTYQWAYVADVLDASTGFNTNQFIEVSSIDVTAAQTAAVTTGLAYAIKVTNPGSGYTSAPTATLVGTAADGTAKADYDLDVTLSGDSISTIDFDSSDIASGSLAFGGINWAHASVVISGGGGSGAEAVALIGPKNGFGFNAAKDLPSYYTGLEATLVGDLEGDAPTIPYRQISLIRGLESDLRTADGDVDGVEYDAEETLDTLRYFTASGSVSGTVSPGDIIEQIGGTDAPAKAFVDRIDTSGANDKIYFHQNNNDLINKKAFPTTGNLTFKIVDRETTSTIVSSVTYTSITEPEYNRGTGEVLFYENRIPITRSAQQTEDIKLVIQL